MRRLRVDEVTRILPDVEELRPVRDRIIAGSVPDPDRMWSGSGELGTVGDRLVLSSALEGTAEQLADEAREHLRAIYQEVGRAIGSLEKEKPVAAAEAFLAASDLEERFRRLDRAEAYALAAERVLEEHRSPEMRAGCLRRLGSILRKRGRWAEAGGRFEEAYETARTAGEVRLAAASAIGRGNVAVDRGAWPEAEAWYRRAQKLLKGEKAAAEHWHVALDLSIVTRRMGDLEASRLHLERAEKLAASMDDRSARTILENGWGMLFRAMGLMEEARARFRGALASADEPLARVTVTVNLAECVLDLGNPIEAGELGRDAEQTAVREGVGPKLPEVYRLLGRVAQEMGHEDAFVFFERAFELIESLALPDFERAQTLETYAVSEARAGRVEPAGDLLEEAMHLYGRLGDEEAEARLQTYRNALEA